MSSCRLVVLSSLLVSAVALADVAPLEAQVRAKVSARFRGAAIDETKLIDDRLYSIQGRIPGTTKCAATDDEACQVANALDVVNEVAWFLADTSTGKLHLPALSLLSFDAATDKLAVTKLQQRVSGIPVWETVVVVISDAAGATLFLFGGLAATNFDTFELSEPTCERQDAICGRVCGCKSTRTTCPTRVGTDLGC